MKIEYTLAGRRGLSPRAFTTEPANDPRGRAPRIARLLALAHKLEALVQSGEVKDCGELARLGHVSAARVSQIILLSQLAPVIQEYVLFLSASEATPISERELRNIAREPRWDRQRELFGPCSRIDLHLCSTRGMNVLTRLLPPKETINDYLGRTDQSRAGNGDSQG